LFICQQSTVRKPTSKFHFNFTYIFLSFSILNVSIIFLDVTNGFQPQAYLTPPASTPECDGNRFPPIGAPFNPPHTGVLPTTWSNFETDLDAPDISNWMAHQISNYFAQHGFGNEVCKVFIEQVSTSRQKLTFIHQNKLPLFKVSLMKHKSTKVSFRILEPLKNRTNLCPIIEWP
jgi:hypothetical protein